MKVLIQEILKRGGNIESLDKQIQDLNDWMDGVEKEKTPRRFYFYGVDAHRQNVYKDVHHIKPDCLIYDALKHRVLFCWFEVEENGKSDLWYFVTIPKSVIGVSKKSARKAAKDYYKKVRARKVEVFKQKILDFILGNK